MSIAVREGGNVFSMYFRAFAVLDNPEISVYRAAEEVKYAISSPRAVCCMS